MMNTPALPAAPAIARDGLPRSRGCVAAHPATTDRRGSAALEFAMVVPVVLTMVIGLFDVGILFGDQHALDHGIDVAARYAVVNSGSASASSIQTVFRQAVQPVLGACGGCSVNVTFSPNYQPGATVTVSATYAWTPTLPITMLTGQTLSSATTLTVQN